MKHKKKLCLILIDYNSIKIYCYVKSMLATLFALSFIIFMANPSNFPCGDELHSANFSSSLLSGRSALNTNIIII